MNAKAQEGFKKTEAGIIPSEWEVKELRRISPSQTVGLVINPSSYFDEKGSVPMLVGSNVSDNGINWASSEKITDASNRSLPSSRVYTGDLVVVRVGEPGTAAVIPKEIDGCNCASMMIIRRHESFCSNWLCFMLNSRIGRSQVEIVQYGTAQKQFNIGDAVDFKFPVPKLHEQRAIAAVLSDMDALISGLDHLIAKKRDIKQATMQQLLTGKTRLPGFSGEWKTRQLGELIEHCSSGATPYRGRPDFYNGNIKWITSGELNYNVITETIEHISVDAAERTNLRLHPAGTFLMAITGLEAAGTRGACGIVGSPATTNQSCMAIYPTPELKNEFLYHYYVFRGDELAFKYCQGTKQQSYTAKLVRLLPIELPPSIEEQIAIANLLSDIDVELATLENRRDKSKQIKQGVMQELLTGKIRLL